MAARSDPSTEESGPSAVEGASPRGPGRIVGAYLVAASVWIVASSAIADDAAGRLGLSHATFETVKGLGFVGFTALILFRAMGGWQRRLLRASDREREASEQLLRVEAMRNAFLAGTSHELRTPLTAIVGYAETLASRGMQMPAGRAAEIAVRLADNAQSMQQLIEDLLEVDHLLQGLGHVRTENCDVGALVRRIVATLPAHERALHVEVADACPVVTKLDVPKIERVIAHLVDNAVRHTPPGTPVGVRVEADGERVDIHVDDEGGGIPPPIADALFEPFVQGADAAQRASPGLGIGLTLVARYVALHGGTVTARNRPHGGARVTVTLPHEPADESIIVEGRPVGMA